jgi:FdhE protein
MMPIDTGLQDLGRRHPEWEPWLAVIREIVDETANPRWNEFAPARAEPQQNRVPLLAGMTLALETGAVSRLLEKLIRASHQGGTPKMATLEPAIHGDLDSLKLFQASLCQDGDRLKEIGADLGADPEAFQAVAALLPVPLLHACNRQWASSRSEAWMEGYCPVCGAWPAFAEVRGIQRSRYFRCGRCGGEWQAHRLVCPYCSMSDHNELESLVPENGGSNRVVEACKRCRGYVKSFTTLQGSLAAKILIDDLASVDLDLAAVQQGYQRPEGTGFSLEVKIVNTSSFGSELSPWIA